MDQSKPDTQTEAKSRGVYLKLGGIQILLNGPLSIIALVVLLAIIVGIFYLMITRTGPATGPQVRYGWLSFFIGARRRRTRPRRAAQNRLRHVKFINC